MNVPNLLARELRSFFMEHLPLVRGVSVHTVQSYRDTFKLLLRFLEKETGCQAVGLDLINLTPEAVIKFLEYLEVERQNCVATRNARLAAIHSFARFLASREPQFLEQSQRLVAIPSKKGRGRTVEYLEAYEIQAMLDSIDGAKREGRRDYALVLTLFNTGARAQEIVDLNVADLQMERPQQAILRGKGRKERVCPLWPRTVDALRVLIADSGAPMGPTVPVFRNRRGERLTRFGIRYLLAKYAKLAKGLAPGIAKKNVHPHVFRHSTAVHLLQAGVDLVTISHWLGHACVETTNRYTAIDLETKRATIESVGAIAEASESMKAWREDKSVLEWLESL